MKKEEIEGRQVAKYIYVRELLAQTKESISGGRLSPPCCSVSFCCGSDGPIGWDLVIIVRYLESRHPVPLAA